MELELENGHPLAAAIRKSAQGGNEVFLVLKEPGIAKNSYFRATVKQWTVTGNTTSIEFESWEQYMERRAQLAGV